MRVSTAVVCTLAVLAAKEINHQAIAAPVPDALDPSSDVEDGRLETATPVPVVSMTLPEVIPLEQRFDSSVRFDPLDLASEEAHSILSPTLSAPSALAEPEEPQSTIQTPELTALPPSTAPSDENEAVSAPLISPSVSPESLIHLERLTQAQSTSPSTPLPSEADLEAEVNPDPLTELADESAPIRHEAAFLTAQATSDPGNPTPLEQEVRDLQQQLLEVEANEEANETDFGDVYEGSPAITIMNPSGYGADNFTGFLNFGYQARTRYSEKDDGTMGIGIGFGDAQESVGFQLSYTMASFGSNRDFGTGGFNAKLHRQFGDGWSAALGWEGFLNVGDDNDFEDSVYGSVTHIFETQDSLDEPFSRIALTAGVGSGRFRTEEAIDDEDNTVGVFGSVAVRLARPLSAIVEWTGQDLAVGLSITPIRGVPWVITPALRDIAGAGDGSRFVLGTGISFRF